MGNSTAESAFLTRWIQLSTVQLEPETEFRFDLKRRWRFDFAFPSCWVAVEIEGGIWKGGGHTTGKGFTANCEKYNRATELGWRVLRYTPQMIENDPLKCIQQIEAVLGSDNDE